MTGTGGVCTLLFQTVPTSCAPGALVFVLRQHAYQLPLGLVSRTD